MTDTNENKIQDKDKWRSALTEEQYRVCRKKGTEAPFTGKYLNNKEEGIYQCVCCGKALFSSDTKFNSGSGWPSYYDVINNNNIVTELDTSHGMRRTEVRCGGCDAHLGHLFPDGPTPTGNRYCINSVSLDFKSEGKVQEK